MVMIEVEKGDRERVFEILLGNGRFRALGDTTFDIVEHGVEVLDKIKNVGIKVKVIS